MPERRPDDPPIPLTMLGELAGDWRFTIRCERCRSVSHRTLEELREKVGSTIALWRVVDRLRCRAFIAATGTRTCGGRAGHVTLAQVHVYGKSMRVLRQAVIRDARAERLLE